MLFLGNASGHDISFHLASWMDVTGQWREGVAFPRWAQWANWGFGEPRFIFYPPASWMFGAALGSVLPWRMVPGTYIWLVLLLSGFAMWRLARELLPDSQAIAAALIFVVNPYQLIVVYYRSDYAELLASSLFPFMVLGALRVVRPEPKPSDSRQNWTGVPLLALAFAAIWLSNAPAAVIATYSLVLLLIVGCLERKKFSAADSRSGSNGDRVRTCCVFTFSPRPTSSAGCKISQVTAGNLHLDQNFLFTHSSDPEFALFNWKVSTSAAGTMLLAGVAAVFGARRRREYPTLWWMMVALATASAIMMLPVSPLVLAPSSEVAIPAVPVALARPAGYSVRIFPRILNHPGALALDLVLGPRLDNRRHRHRDRSRRLVGQRRHPVPRSGNSYWPRFTKGPTNMHRSALTYMISLEQF